jgi:hypothetical protein
LPPEMLAKIEAEIKQKQSKAKASTVQKKSTTMTSKY